MKEVNEAYDSIIKNRSKGGYQTNGGPSYGGGRQAGGGGEPAFQKVRQLLDQGQLAEAQRLLEASTARNAEWHYLMGGLSYRRGWLSEARDNFTMACNMEPGNMEYRQAAEYLNNQTNRGFQTYRRGGFDLSDVCGMLMCYSCCCNGCG